ncbi:autotransporter-associated beta strand repeat-containing protein [Luteolibacter sp. Populi]|uniref:autotransporter-associated beta strand repeat-containing protein n=1 Tax=Luteolibacter sp. Populi TaxID=3230487 RepID=UPI003467A7DA
MAWDSWTWILEFVGPEIQHTSNANPGSTVTLNNNLGTITLTSALPLITAAVTIQGGTGNTVSGAGLYRVFFVDAPAQTVALQSLTIAGGRAKGGSGSARGGGGMGAGGAIFVDAGQVTLTAVSFSNNSAVGGGGGNASPVDIHGGGGGGLGGSGGFPGGNASGGGGGYGGNGGNDGGGGGGLIGNGGSGSDFAGGGGGGLTDGGNASGASGGAGGTGGGNAPNFVNVSNSFGGFGSLYGGGGSTARIGSFGGQAIGGTGGKYGGGGGMFDSTSQFSAGSMQAGHGGDYGGGGGDRLNAKGGSHIAGNGGYGGGGGGGCSSHTVPSDRGRSGNGGFGGGGGGNVYEPASGGRFGGNGGHYSQPVGNPFSETLSGGGGGGAALGGNIFVRGGNGATVTFINTVPADGSVTGGVAGADHVVVPNRLTLAQAGQARGSNLFLDGGLATFNLSSGVQTFTGSIADASSVGGTAASLTKTGAGTLEFTGIPGYGGVTLISAGTLRLNSPAALTFASATSGGGILEKAGAGVLTLSGANLHSGGTIISGGILQLGNGGTTGSLAGNITNNGTLSFNRSDATSFGGIISGSGALVKNGAELLTLTGDSTYSGTTTVNTGTLRLSGDLYADGTTAGSISVNSGATLSLNRQDILGNHSFNSPAVLTIQSGGLVTNAGGNVYNTLSNLVINGGELRADGGSSSVFPAYQLKGTVTTGGTSTSTIGTTAAANSQIQIGNNSAGGLTTFAVADATGNSSPDLSIAATLQDGRSFGAGGTGLVASGLVKTGPGTLVLGAYNLYSGPTTVSSGTLKLESNTLSPAFAIASAATLELNANNGTLSYDSALPVTTISGAGTLRKTGTGLIVWEGKSAHFELASGSLIDVQAGVFSGGSFGNEVWLLNKSDLNVAAGATFNGVEANVRVDSLSGAGKIQSGYDGNRQFTFGVDDGGGTFPGELSDNAGLTGNYTKQGSGIQTLSGTNTFTGVLTISGGALQIGEGGTTGSLATPAIANNAALTFNRSNDVVYTGVISGSGLVSKLGTGTLTLSGTQSYTGGTNVAAGTLQIGSGGSTGSIAGNISNEGTLVFNRSTAFTFGGLITGSGSLAKLGAETLILTGDNTYSGTTTISGGTLQVGNGGSGGTLGSGPVANNGALVFNRAGDLSIATGISGTGSLTKLGTGTLVLAADNTYSGTTTITAGTLQIGTGGSTGTFGSGAVINNGSLVLNTSGQSLLSGSISGTGSLVKLGQGTTILTGTNTYTGSTTIAAGTLQVSGSGSIPGNVVTNGVLAFNSSAALTVGSVISGTGALAKLGSGTLTLTNENTYSAGTTITAGTLQIGNGGSSGSIAGNVTADGTLVFNRADDFNFNGTISGTGALTKLGTGILTLTANNLFSGTTTVAAGTLQIGNGGATGSIGGDVITNDALVVNRTGDLALGGFISGTGNLVKLGSNILTLTNNNNYSGGTTITGGTLQIGDGGGGGSFGGGALVNNGALILNRYGSLSGTGNVTGSGSLTKTGSGTLAISGDYAHTGGTTVAGGTLQIGDGSIFGSIAGPITINGTLAFNRFDSITYGSIISGGGSLAQLGWGTLTLTANNTYGGNTTVGEGTLSIGAGGTSGSVAGNITNDGALIFNRSDTVTYTRVISGVGTVTKLGAGTLIFTGGNRYTGGTTIAEGTLQLGIGGAGGVIFLTSVVNNGALVFNRSANIGPVNLMSGTGSLTKLGIGMLTLGEENTYTGATNVNSGILRVSGALYNEGSVAASITVNAGGTLNLFRDNILGTHMANPVTALTINAGGLVTNTGGNFFNTFNILNLNGGELHADGGADQIFPAYQLKGTVTAAGTVPSQITTSGATNSDFHLGNNAEGGFTTFDVADVSASSAADLTISAILGNGRDGNATLVPSGLVKTGPGTLTLAGANTYTAATTVSTGTLLVNGSLADTPVNVTGGATLGGSGSIGGQTTIPGTARLAPGNGSSPGTLTFTNGLALGAASILDLRIGDLIRVSGGTASGPLSGTIMVNLSDAGGFSGGTFTLLDASGATLDGLGAGSFTLGSVIPGYTYQFSQAGSLIQLTATAPTPYDTWSSIIGDPALRERSADPDGDGFSNLLEYLFGTSAILPEGSLVASDRTPDGLVIRWLQRNSDASFQLEESGSLAGPWPPSALPVTDADQTGAPAGYTRKQAVVPFTQGLRFFRIQGLEN